MFGVFTAAGGDAHLQQAAGVGVHGSIFELVGVHLAQAFKAADGVGAIAHAFGLQALEDAVELLLV